MSPAVRKKKKAKATKPKLVDPASYPKLYFEACRKGNLLEVQRREEIMMSTLHMSIEAIQKLQRPRRKETGLILACQNKHIDLALYLADRPGADFNARDKDDRTALIYAVDNQLLPVVRHLLSKQELDVNQREESTREEDSALHRAVRLHSVELVQCLLEDPRTDMNLRNAQQQTPLHVAAAAAVATATAAAQEESDNNGDVAQTVWEYFMQQKRNMIQINARDFRGNTPLHLAVQQPLQDEEGTPNKKNISMVVRSLLDHPDIQLSVVNNDGNTALHVAWSGSLEFLPWELMERWMAQHSVGLVTRNNCSRTPLLALVACFSKKKEDFLKQLLQQNPYEQTIELNAQDHDGNTALHFAALRQESGLLDMLLEHPGIKVFQTNRDGDTALHIAAANCWLHGVRRLAVFSEILNAFNIRHETPLCTAMTFRNTSVVKEQHDAMVECLLQQEGINVNMYDRDGNTVLHNLFQPASYYVIRETSPQQVIDRREELVELMLAHCPELDIFQPNRSGNNALHLAACFPGSRLLPRLVEHSTGSPAINRCNHKQNAPLHIAVREIPKGELESEDCKTHETWLSSLLQQETLDVNVRNAKGETALHIACHRQSLVSVRGLLDHPRMDPCIQSHKGETVMHTAVKRGCLPVVEHLVQQCSALLQVPNHRLETPLHYAVLAVTGHRFGDGWSFPNPASPREVLNYLLQQKSALLDVNARDHNGNTALHVACSSSCLKTVRGLLDHHSDFQLYVANHKQATVFGVTESRAVQTLLSKVELMHLSRDIQLVLEALPCPLPPRGGDSKDVELEHFANNPNPLFLDVLAKALLVLVEWLPQVPPRRGGGKSRAECALNQSKNRKRKVSDVSREHPCSTTFQAT